MTTWSTTWTLRSSVHSYPPREQREMKKIAKISLAAAILGALVVLILVSGCGGGDDDAVVVTLTPSSIDAEPGGSFTVDVEVDPKGQGISAAEVTINYDPQVFAYEGMSAGGLLGISPLVGDGVDGRGDRTTSLRPGPEGRDFSPDRCRDSRNADVQGARRRAGWRARADSIPGRACGRESTGRAVDCVQSGVCEFVGPTCSAGAYRLPDGLNLSYTR